MGIASVILSLILSALAPVWSVDDRANIPEPKVHNVNQFEDIASPIIIGPAKHFLDFPRNIRKIANAPKEAEDTNGLDEVPDSSWFTNRNFLHPMTPRAIMLGAVPEDPPDAGPWKVKKCKSAGVSTGLQVEDSKGDLYIIKLDPEDYPELASSADVIASRFFYAAGYNVPKNTIVEFDPNVLIPNTNLQCTGAKGEKFVMDKDGIRRLLQHAGRTTDGRIRGMASKYLEGKPKGPFSYT